MDLIRHRMLLNAISSQSTSAETIVVYDYDTAPSTLNGTVLSGSYSSLGSYGLRMLGKGSDTLSCYIGTYDLTNYSAMEIVGGQRNFNITSLYVAVFDAAGGAPKALIQLKSVMASNEMSNFTPENGNYSTHYMSLEGITGNCKIQLYMSGSGTTQLNCVSFKRLAFIADGGSDLPYKVEINGTGDESTGWISIDGQKYLTDSVAYLEAGAHAMQISAYQLTWFGTADNAGSDVSLVKTWSKTLDRSAKITITKKQNGTGLFSTVYYEITVEEG